MGALAVQTSTFVTPGSGGTRVARPGSCSGRMAISMSPARRPTASSATTARPGLSWTPSSPRTVADFPAPSTLVFGPDGNLYVTSIDTSSVLRYDGTTGASSTSSRPEAGWIAPRD